MKILYGIQGTGNGHISRGKFIYNLLKKYSNNIDVLLSGNNYSLNPEMPIKYYNKGITFSIKNGKIDYLRTLSNFDLYTSYLEQKEIPFKNYDVIITDFEPITAWSSVRFSIPSIHISHQASFINPNVPRPNFKNLIGEYVMKYFCPTNDHIGLHYQKYGDNISEPIILNHFSSSKLLDKDHITVYLPWYQDEFLYNFFKKFKNLEFQIFSKNTKVLNKLDNCLFFPINESLFSKSICESYGVIANAGFQTTSEVIYLGKRLLAIPVEGQYEQACNAEALKNLGVVVMDKINASSYAEIDSWLKTKPVKISFQNNVDELLKNKINKII